MASLPDDYTTLARWLPSLSARADVLGLSRQTLTAWERRQQPAVRRATARAIERVAAVAELAERRIGEPRGVGRWLRAPQPALGGRSPAELLRASDPAGWSAVRRSLSPIVQASARRVAFTELRKAADEPRSTQASTGSAARAHAGGRRGDPAPARRGVGGPHPSRAR